MISFTLKCANAHSFDSWFQSSAAFDKLMQARMVSCPTCGATDVAKSMMAPRVRPARSAAKPMPEGADKPRQPAPQTATDHTAPQPARPPQPSSAETTKPADAIAALKAEVEKNSDYVGKDFASQARAMHDGSAPERSIYGEANLAEAKALIEEGVPVAPLPFIPTRKTN